MGEFTVLCVLKRVMEEGVVCKEVEEFVCDTVVKQSAHAVCDSYLNILVTIIDYIMEQSDCNSF